MFGLVSCIDIEQSSPQMTYGHPFDSVNRMFNYNSEIWDIEFKDSTTLTGDSIMYYSNNKIAKSIPFKNGKRLGSVNLYDSLGNLTAQMNYHLDTLTIEFKVSYPQTGLIKYNYHFLNNHPIGVYQDFYNQYHDSVFIDGYIYSRSTRLIEYRLYDITGELWFKREFFEDQTIKLDSGHSVIPISKSPIRQIGKPIIFDFWDASPQGTQGELTIRNNQTGEIDTIELIEGLNLYTFIPKKEGKHRFTVFHNLLDTLSNTVRKDSVTFMVNIGTNGS